MRRELGKWILDVAKYVATAGLIAPFLTKVDSLWWYIGMVVVVLGALVVGLILTKEDVKPKKKK